MTRELFSYAAGILACLAYAPYLRELLRPQNPTRPSRASWIIWTILEAVLLYALIEKGAPYAQVLGAFIGAVITLAVVLYRGTGGWSSIEQFALAALMPGLLLWYLVGDAIVGMAVCLTLGFIGTLPTFEVMWKDPDRESRFAWTIWFVSTLFALAAVPAWGLSDVAQWIQPMVFFVSQLAMMYLLWVRPVCCFRLR